MRPCIGCGQPGTGMICMLCVGKRARLRQLQVMTMRECGLSRTEIAARMSLGVERIRQIINGARQNVFRITVDGRVVMSGDGL
jgi:hypothetical protein